LVNRAVLLELSVRKTVIFGDGGFIATSRDAGQTGPAENVAPC
jgi:hypothetical protein